MTSPQDRHVVAHLRDDYTSVVIGGDGGMPEVWWWGGRLADDTDLAAGTGLPAELWDRPVPGGGLDVDPPVGLITEASRGWFGRPGIEGCRDDGRDFAPRFALTDSDVSHHRATFVCVDAQAALRLRLVVELRDGVVIVDAELTNTGDDDYVVSGLRASLPVGGEATELVTYGGRHLFEFAEHRTPWDRQVITVENRHGKTSHERMGAMVAGSAGFGEHTGTVWGVHLGWSGNYELLADAVTDGRRILQCGELLLPGEGRLAPGASYAMPTVYGVAATGLTAMSNRFHGYLRSRPSHPKLPRPVHLNTWEAVYFDHDLDRLKELADVAATVGIERFVLDDGWFGSRRDDTSGLGDWWISPDVWPDGLAPIIDHVRGLGMEFGIWFEPEMINPDSELYREHPDWALVDARYPLVLGRNQLVLDVGRGEVRDYLFEKIDAVLSAYDIAYVKWDHNRDMVSPATAGDRAGVHAQTLGIYALFDRLRQAHPSVEFESCASGGGRVDFGILDHTVRVWTSDSIDALDRQSIQRGFSVLFPPELMGAHVGDARCHSTGRVHQMGFRTSAALFGAFGVESNIVALNEAERSELAAAIAFHKRHRDLLHTGTVVRLDHPDPTVWAHGVVATDHAEAIFAVTRMESGPTHHTPSLRLVGLDPQRTYRVSVASEVSDPLGGARRQPAWITDAATATGDTLAAIGLPIPQLNPETTIVIHVQPAP